VDKKNKTLQDILSNYQEIEMKLIEADGEIDDKLDYLLSINELELSEKLEGYEKFVRYIKGQIVYLKSMEELYFKRRRILENSVKKCKKSMLNAMSLTGNKRIKTKEFSFTLGKTEQWDIDTNQIKDSSKQKLIDEGCADNIFKINLNQLKLKYKESDEKIPDWVSINENLFIRVL